MKAERTDKTCVGVPGGISASESAIVPGRDRTPLGAKDPEKRRLRRGDLGLQCRLSGLPAVLCCLVVLWVSVAAGAVNAGEPSVRPQCRRFASAPSAAPGVAESSSAAAVAVSAGGDGAGEEVPAAAAAALDHYAARRLSAALAAFADAAVAVRRELAAELTACLPPAPRGWRIEDTDVRADARGATGITVRRRYRHAAGAVAVAIAALSPFVQGTRSLIENPSLLPQGGGMTIISWRGFPALAGSAPGGGREVQIVIAADCLLIVTGPPADREGGLDYDEILGAIDFPRLQRLVTDSEFPPR